MRVTPRKGKGCQAEGLLRGVTQDKPARRGSL